MTRSALIQLVFRGELHRLLRDQRAVLFGLVLPVVAFPLLFLFSGSLDKVGQEQLDAKVVRIAMDLNGLGADAEARLSALLAEEDANVERVDVDVEGEPDEEAVLALLEEHDALLLVAARPGAEEGAPPELVVYQTEADESVEEAEDRVRDAARAVLRELRTERLVAAVGRDPGLRFEPIAVDVASAEDAAGMQLGFYLPLLAVLVLISGGSFAALDAFCGEREAGTLETLLVQPAPASAVAWGKFLAVLATGVAAFLGNALSLLACLALGLGELDVAAGLDWPTTALRISIGCAIFLPTACLLAAVLSLISARARSFGQGQLFTMPLTFLAMALVAPAISPTTELGPLLAMVPVTGASLALRDAAAGTFRAVPMLAAALAGTGWAALALRRLASTMDAERLLATAATSSESSARKLSAVRAIRFGIGASLLVYVVGGMAQARWPLGGLVFTLWGLVLLLALVAARGKPAALGLNAPRVEHLVGALCLAPPLALGVERLFELQQRLLPMPSRIGEMEGMFSFTQELPLWALVFVMAVSPGVCEELLFRGALLGQMRKDLSPKAVVLWQALLFGIVHASVYRFVPTALVGSVLAMVALRARGVVPSIVLHTAYNAVLVLATLGGMAWLGSAWWALLVVPGMGLLVWRRG